MNIINIQSITDIVTNSSTEVFIRVKETAINTVKANYKIRYYLGD